MDERAIRHRAIDLNGECWRLLEKPDRTPAETAAMVAAAKESLDLWKQVGTAVNAQRGAWLVARAAVDARDVDGALDFALKTLELTTLHRDELADFDLAFAEEIVARAAALAGDTERAARHHAEAKRLGEAICDPEDRKEFLRQFAIGPWFGMGGRRSL